jgi:4-diphosphocytidyl-2-C-methyl-D-erythritol kinase
MIWPAPAKLNLFLHVVGRRVDGYHLLQTVFQFLDYCDELEFGVTEDGRISRIRESTDIPPETDLTLRAAHLLQRALGAKQGAAIELRKRVPIGGGLGGGSSDAATTLVALNALWGGALSTAELAALGLTLGADVPLFIRGHAAWAEGVGEVLTPVELAEPWYLVAVPPVHVSTAHVYAEFAAARGLTPYTAPRTIRDLQAGYGRNDLENVVRRRYPAVDVAFTWLARYGRPRMTGSGGCVYIEVPDPEQGARLLADRPSAFDGFVARGLNRHPLTKGRDTKYEGRDPRRG